MSYIQGYEDMLKGDHIDMTCAKRDGYKEEECERRIRFIRGQQHMQHLKNFIAILSFILLIGVVGGMDRGTIPMVKGLIAGLGLVGILYARGKEDQVDDN